MLYPYLYINGEILPREKALIPVYDLGLLRGHGIFDFFRVIDGIPIFAEDHINRLENSLRLMHLETGITREEWLSLFYQMIEVNRAERAGFRIVVTGGFSEDGYSLPEEKNVYLMLHHLPADDNSIYDNGVYLITASFQRDMPIVKTTNYLRSMQLQPDMKASGAFEVLYHQDGAIRECSRCNIFFIDHDGIIHTPDKAMLKGVTRLQTLASIQENNIPLREREVRIDELASMAGAFLTATTKGVVPVVKVGDQVIGDGSVHPVARLLREEYERKVAAYIQRTKGAGV